MSGVPVHFSIIASITAVLAAVITLLGIDLDNDPDGSGNLAAVVWLVF